MKTTEKFSKEPLVFRHSGLLGDIIYSLPTVKKLGLNNIFLVDAERKFAGKAPISKAMSEQMCEVLETQEYIKEARLHKEGDKIDHDLDSFRRSKRVYKQHLAITHYEAIGGQDKLSLTDPWLSIDPMPIAEIVVARSKRRHGDMDYDLLKDFKGKIIYLGFPDEFNYLKHRIPLELYKCDNLLIMMRIIAGAKLFIGNQSLGLAFAEGLKVPRCVEIYKPAPNCMPQSNNGHINLTRELLDNYVNQK